jgi:hypothetical protein
VRERMLIAMSSSSMNRINWSGDHSGAPHPDGSLP